MKVMLVNGSSRANGCTGTALKIIADTLAEEGIGSEIINIGNKPMSDYVNCHVCRKKGECAFDDIANEIGKRAAEFDGFVFGSPVYYAHPSGRLITAMDRAFYSNKDNFAFKPAAAVFSARRSGQVSSMDVINKYFSISSMPIVSSTYWNHVYGAQPEDVLKDAEGVQTMVNLAKNMAWMLKCIELGCANGIAHPVNEKVITSFHR